MWFESSGFAPEPVMPFRLFASRTSSIVYATTFINFALIFWATFFLPLYFMSVQLSSPSWTGVQALPLSLVAMPGAALSAVILARYGRYKALHLGGFGLLTIGWGLFSTLDKDSPTWKWAIFEVVFAFGLGMLMNTILPAFQAGVSEADQAAATSSWAFMRSFAGTWGVAIPSAVFNSYTAQYAGEVGDPVARAALSGGDAYASATKYFVESFAEPTRSELISVFTKAIQKVFLVAIPFAGFAFLLSLGEREVKLRTELETDFGMEEVKPAKASQKDEEAALAS